MPASQAFQVDERWAQRCVGYHLQMRPSDSSLPIMLQLQDGISIKAPLALNMIPVAALHLSVATLVPAQIGLEEAERQWLQVEPEVRDALARNPLEHDFTITFTQIKFTDRAIILRAKDQPYDLRTVRRVIGRILRRNLLPVPNYDQAHVTLGRYAETASMQPTAIQAIERSDCSIVISFDRLRLVRERRYPSLEIEEI